jgi:hypothetical protein
MHRTTCAALVVALLGAVKLDAQQPAKWHWSLAGGPSFTLGTSFTVVRGNTLDVVTHDTVLLGDHGGKYHAALGVSRSLGTSSLTLRGDLVYAHIRSASGSVPTTFYGLPARRVLGEDVFAADLGLQWDAFPTRAFSPYLLTSVGVMHSRLGWSSDSAATKPDETALGWSPTLGLGTGMRLRIGRREVFTELRTYRRGGNHGSNISPISIGFRF